MTGFKFKNGKFVERTAEQAQRREAYFAKVAKPKRVAKSSERFIRVTMWQLDKLIPKLSKSPEVSVFFVLCYEDFRHRGAAFVWPGEKLQEIAGLSARTQQRAIVYLEKAGLISVMRHHRKPPTVQVLSVKC
jgi:hypothetical protein